MKNYNRNKKIIALVYIISQFFVLLAIPSFAQSDDYIENSSETTWVNSASNNVGGTSNLSTSVTLPELTYTVTNPFESGIISTRIAFDEIEGAVYDFYAEGLTVIENTDAPIYDLIAGNDSFGTFRLDAEMPDGSIINKTIYTYSNETSMFISEASRDIAFHKCKQLELEDLIIDLDGWHLQYSTLTLEFSESVSDVSYTDKQEITNALNNGKVVIRGKMFWQIENNNIPMIKTKVELRDNKSISSDDIATAVTDENGEYYFIIDPNELIAWPNSTVDLFVRTYTESTTFEVMHPFVEGFNYFDTELINVTSSTTGIINVSRRLINDTSNSIYKLAFIQQGMVVGQEFAIDMGMVVSNENLYVFYVGDLSFFGKINTGIGDIDNVFNKISEMNKNAFCYDRYSFIGSERWNEFLSCTHEYGHYVENRIGTYGTNVKGRLEDKKPEADTCTFPALYDFLIDLLNATEDYYHDFDKNNFDKTTTTKDFQMELTWSEAWADAFAEIAFKKYIDKYADFLFEKDEILLEKVDALFKKDVNFEVRKKYLYDGEASEYAVASFLWDLYDNTPSEEGDTINDLTDRQWWDLTTANNTCTIHGFTTNIIENHPELIIDGMGSLLSKHKISPVVLDIINPPCSFGNLRLNWISNGGSSHKNNKFRVAFIDENGVVLYISETEINAVKTTDDYYYYDVPQDIWITVLGNKTGDEVYAIILGRLEGAADKASYFSKPIKVWSEDQDHIRGDLVFDDEGHWYKCKCGIDCTTRTNHTLSYTVNAENHTHIKSCSRCDYLVPEEHIYTLSSKSDTTHTYQCACGVSSTSAHSRMIALKVGSSEYHRATCYCGTAFDEPHTASRYTTKNNLYHNIICDCGQVIGQSNHDWQKSGTKNICRQCGQVSSMLDGPILWKTEDDEEYE